MIVFPKSSFFILLEEHYAIRASNSQSLPIEKVHVTQVIISYSLLLKFRWLSWIYRDELSLSIKGVAFFCYLAIEGFYRKVSGSAVLNWCLYYFTCLFIEKPVSEMILNLVLAMID